MKAEGVSAFLDRGETLIWSGRQTALGYALKKGGVVFLFGLVFFAFSLFWIHGAMGAPGIFWFFGIPFVLIGAGLVLSPIWYYVKAGRTQFGLTNRRAVIDMQGPFGKRLSVPLRDVPFVELQLSGNGTGHVLFTQDSIKYQSTPRKDGFIAIANAADIERKLRDAIETSAREPIRAK